MPFERRVALRNSGLIDPRDIGQYIERCRGYSGLTRAMELGAGGVLAEFLQADLRASEGDGRSVAAGWGACQDAEGDEKYVICNAVDPDARAQTARLLLGTDPHAVLEGLLIAALSAGASRCYVCINADYREEIETVEEALRQMSSRGLVGDDILGSDLSCHVAIKEIAPSLIAAEDTALIRALENRQPLPYLAAEDICVSGLHGQPTLIESAETLAKVSAVFQDNPTSDGTKIVTVSGDVPREATVEVPLGTTIRAVLEGTQGAKVNELDLVAVQFGGPAGVFFAAESLDTPIDFEGLGEAGGTMGSGSLYVYGAGRCAVAMARDLTALVHEESCGKCVFCREGTRQLLDILDDVLERGADEEQMALLVELGEAMKNGSICSLGRQASAPVLSSLRLFADDYRSHNVDKRCRGATK